MGLSSHSLAEQNQPNISKNPITATVTGVSIDSNAGTTGVNQGVEDFSQGFVGADTALDAVRQGIGVTPISQGIVNEIVLDYHYKTGPFTLKYSFSNDIKIPGGVIPKNTSFTTKNANYIGLTKEGQTISVETPTPVESSDSNDTGNRNKKIVDLFKSVGITISLSSTFVTYFRKNIRPILRRIKKELPEYRLQFIDQPTTELVTDSFIRIKDILLESYNENLKQLKDLIAAKDGQKKDKKMTGILEKEIEKEKKKLLTIVKPKFKKIFKDNIRELTDNDIVSLISSFEVFLQGLKEDYPQYKINFNENQLKEEEDVETKTPKDMLIHLDDKQDIIFISRKYPCTVSIDGKQTGQNTINIMDVTSRYVYKGGAKQKTTQGGASGNTKTEEEFYTLPIYNQLQNDKGKLFDVSMSVDIDPQVYLAQHNEHASLLRKHEGDLWKYKIKMMDNGFELVDIKTSQGETIRLPAEAQLRMLFPRETEKIEFGKQYRVTVLQNNDNIGKLYITVDDVKKQTSGF